MGLYFVVLKQNIYCSTTWSTKKKLFESEENEYRCFFERMQDKVVYARRVLLHQLDQILKDQMLDLKHDV